jgi:DNA-binding XRE family transcriptional regulator
MKGFRLFDDVRAEAADHRTPEQQAVYEELFEAAGVAMRVAQMVYDARKKAGLTQIALAKAAGTTQATISQVEGGGQIPTLMLLHRIAYATGQQFDFSLTSNKTKEIAA